jgi:CspA family cold shock protein
MATGTVKFFNQDRGFGFIAPSNGGSDVFVHITAIERAGMSSIREGQKLSYEVETDRRSGKAAAANLQEI